ncbi:hypothetical protein [Lentzea aerocolonigenes]|uniref:hypothetical protein n=1 Tax=Lentzea aerocolonigenes TaxID=68170 RepID=UPI0004C31CFC|nr:hypothetical protein [Lentzea aerocolonigenes]MCP2248499.1 hypothetical protein [Lentzea aerocolonigenes]
MPLDLPHRRALPEDVKERMRPAFTQSRVRGRRAPLAVAAGVLLIAGGVVAAQIVTQPVHEVDSGHLQVVAPSSRDLDRCRAALNDQNWRSTRMVVFDLRKVLVGEDGRFCELTRTRARVAAEDFKPAALEEGSIAFRSTKIIAGVPPAGARTVHAVNSGYTHSPLGPGPEGVVTPGFFVVETPGVASELVFDDRTMRMPTISPKPATVTDSYENSDTDPWSEESVLARCVDIASDGGRSAEELGGFEPLMVTGLDKHHGMMIAHREHEKWAYCSFSGGTNGGLQLLNVMEDDPDKPFMFTGDKTGSDYSVVGRVDRAAKSVQVSDGDHPPVSAEIADGHFLAAVPMTDDEAKTIPTDRLHLVVRNDKNQIIYEGGFG